MCKPHEPNNNAWDAMLFFHSMKVNLENYETSKSLEEQIKDTKIT